MATSARAGSPRRAVGTSAPVQRRERRHGDHRCRTPGSPKSSGRPDHRSTAARSPAPSATRDVSLRGGGDRAIDAPMPCNGTRVGRAAAQRRPSTARQSAARSSRQRDAAATRDEPRPGRRSTKRSSAGCRPPQTPSSTGMTPRSTHPEHGRPAPLSRARSGVAIRPAGDEAVPCEREVAIRCARGGTDLLPVPADRRHAGGSTGGSRAGAPPGRQARRRMTGPRARAGRPSPRYLIRSQRGSVRLSADRRTTLRSIDLRWLRRPDAGHVTAGGTAAVPASWAPCLSERSPRDRRRGSRQRGPVDRPVSHPTSRGMHAGGDRRRSAAAQTTGLSAVQSCGPMRAQRGACMRGTVWGAVPRAANRGLPVGSGDTRVYTCGQVTRPLRDVGDQPTFLRVRGDRDDPSVGGALVSRDFIGALLQLNAEKQVPREVLVRALEEGIQAAYRRVAGEEDIHVEVNQESGAIRVFRARYAASEIEDPLTEFTLDEARKIKAGREAGRPDRDRAARRRPLRPDRRPDREADHPAADPRGRARPGLRPVRQPRRRPADRQREPGGAARDHPRRRQGRGGHPRHQRAEPARALPHRPAGEGVRARGAPFGARAADPRSAGPTRASCAGCSSWRCRRSTPGRSRSRRSPARPAAARRSPSRRARRASTRSGATVGQRGARVQAVVAELAGEKIDVIPWSDDASVFVANALSPAQVLVGRHRRGEADRQRHGPGADALARDRPRGPERPARRPPHRLADRHPQRRRAGREGPRSRGGRRCSDGWPQRRGQPTSRRPRRSRRPRGPSGPATPVPP